MARRFLYIIAGLVVLVLVVLVALRLFADDFSQMAFVPDAEFAAPPPLAQDAYARADMWLSRPGLGEADPARQLPAGMMPEPTALGAAVFFVHPTSYFEKTRWNAPLDDPAARD